MLLTDSHAIREVILFPLLRAETAENPAAPPQEKGGDEDGSSK
jgi:aspartyl-tRNA synthetase